MTQQHKEKIWNTERNQLFLYVFRIIAERSIACVFLKKKSAANKEKLNMKKIAKFIKKTNPALLATMDASAMLCEKWHSTTSIIAITLTLSIQMTLLFSFIYSPFRRLPKTLCSAAGMRHCYIFLYASINLSARSSHVQLLFICSAAFLPSSLFFEAEIISFAHFSALNSGSIIPVLPF